MKISQSYQAQVFNLVETTDSQQAKNSLQAKQEQPAETDRVSISPEAFTFLQNTEEAENKNQPLDIKEIMEKIKELQQQLTEVQRQIALLMSSDLPQEEKIEQLQPLQEQAELLSGQIQELIQQLQDMFEGA